MKKLGIFALVLVLTVTIAGCRRKEEPNKEPNTTTTLPATSNMDPIIETNIPDPNVDTSMPDGFGTTDNSQNTTQDGNMGNQSRNSGMWGY